MLARPIREGDPVVLEVKVAGVQEKTGQLSFGFHVKIGEPDHRHFVDVLQVKALVVVAREVWLQAVLSKLFDPTIK